MSVMPFVNHVLQNLHILTDILFAYPICYSRRYIKISICVDGLISDFSFVTFSLIQFRALF